jgi:spermidine synthase
MFRLGSSRPFRSRQATAQPGIEISEADGVRALHIDSSTVQSAMRVNAPYDLELTYSRGIMTFLLFRRQVCEVLVLGLGGGSIPKFIHHYLPEMRTRVVEINPQVIAIARSHFMLPPDDARLQVIEGDGAEYLRANPAKAELLILDVFDGKGIPPELYSQAFFDSSAEALATDGILAVNLWGSDKNFDIYLQRIEQSFGHRVLVMPTGRPGNIVVFGFRRPPADLRWATLRERAKALALDFRIEFLEFVERLRDNNPNTSNRLIL